MINCHLPQYFSALFRTLLPLSGKRLTFFEIACRTGDIFSLRDARSATNKLNRLFCGLFSKKQYFINGRICDVNGDVTFVRWLLRSIFNPGTRALLNEATAENRGERISFFFLPNVFEFLSHYLSRSWDKQSFKRVLKSDFLIRKRPFWFSRKLRKSWFFSWSMICWFGYLSENRELTIFS